MSQDALAAIQKELAKYIEPKYKQGATNFFKEEIRLLGVRTPTVRLIAREYFPKGKNKAAVFALCEQLLKERTIEATTIAFAWAYRMRTQLAPTDFVRFERWLKTYVDNWAFCDDFCTHAFGAFLAQYPQFISNVTKWTTSKNRWQRRASAVIFIYPVRKQKYLPHVFDIAKRLLTDDDDLVQKGYGWMLKEAGNVYPVQVFAFVMKHKKNMPRTALRYAIEKYPKDMKQKAMAPIKNN